MPLYITHNYADASISHFSQISKEFFFRRNCQEILGAGPLIGLYRFFAKNGPDLSQYATLYKPIIMLMLASAILVKFRRNFFFLKIARKCWGLVP